MTYHSQWLFPVPVIYTENSAITDARLQTICRDMAFAHGARTFECPCLTTIASQNQVLDEQVRLLLDKVLDPQITQSVIARIDPLFCLVIKVFSITADGLD